MASRIALRCEQCETMNVIHGPAVAKNNSQQNRRRNDSTQYSVNAQATLAMQRLGVGIDGIETLHSHLGLAGSAMIWTNSSLFQRMEEEISKGGLAEMTTAILEEALLEEIEQTLRHDCELLLKLGFQDIQQWIDLPNDLKRSYRVPITILYDMGWQKRGTGRMYNSNSGHAFMIGAKTKKIIGIAVMSKICAGCKKAGRKLAKGIITQQEEAKEIITQQEEGADGVLLCNLDSIHAVSQSVDEDNDDEEEEDLDDLCHPCQPSVQDDHICTANYFGSSKGMESIGFLRLVIDGCDNQGFIVAEVVADDDSSIRANANHIDDNDNGLLPPRVPPPTKWHTDANHFIRHMVKKVFDLTKTVGDGQNPTRFFCTTLQRPHRLCHTRTQ